MGVEITPTYAHNAGRSTGRSAAYVAGPIRLKGNGTRLTVVRIDNLDATASDYVEISKIGLKGFIDAAWNPDAAGDVALLTKTAAGRITFSHATNTDCDGYLWILTGA